jgi:hypothetical protein
MNGPAQQLDPALAATPPTQRAIRDLKPAGHAGPPPTAPGQTLTQLGRTHASSLFGPTGVTLTGLAPTHRLR